MATITSYKFNKCLLSEVLYYKYCVTVPGFSEICMSSHAECNWYVIYLIIQGFSECVMPHYLSRLMGKPTICIGKNKDADQLHGNREADQTSSSSS